MNLVTLLEWGKDNGAAENICFGHCKHDWKLSWISHSLYLFIFQKFASNILTKWKDTPKVKYSKVICFCSVCFKLCIDALNKQINGICLAFYTARVKQWWFRLAPTCDSQSFPIWLRTCSQAAVSQWLDASYTKQWKWYGPTLHVQQNSSRWWVFWIHEPLWYLWDSTEWQLFLSTCPVAVQSAADQRNDREGGSAGGLAGKP